MNSIGENYRVTLIGSSHGNMVGVIVEGIPAGSKIDSSRIEQELMRRRPGQSKVTTDRKEADKLIIEAGLLNSVATGEPFVAYVRNQDVDSSYYDEIKNTPRPGHADYPAYVKYKGANDYRGGGRFSGRMTIGLVIAGSIAKQLMGDLNIKITAFSKEIGGVDVGENFEVPNDDFIFSETNTVRTVNHEIIKEMEERILEVKDQGDSVGGIVQCVIENLPIGVGEPWFNSIESKLSHMLFSIPAVKGVEFGSGFKAAKMTGSRHNDEYLTVDSQVVTKTNNAGGILGGLSNGMPIILQVAFKPTSSIALKQNTIDKKDLSNTSLKVKGRHDPCIVPRAVPVVSNAAACVIYDLLRSGDYL